MKKYNKLAVLFIMSLLLFSGGIEKVNAGESEKYVTFVEQVLRHARSDQTKPIAHFESGEELSLIEKSDDFFKVSTQNGQIGYVERSLVTSKENYQDYQLGEKVPIHHLNAPYEWGARDQYIVVGDAILRTGDATVYQPISLLKRGTELIYLGTTDNRWFKVLHEGQEGYVFRGDVTSVENYRRAESGIVGDIHEVPLKKMEDFNQLTAVMETNLRARDNREYAVVYYLKKDDLIHYKGTTKNNWFFVTVNPGQADEQEGYIQRGHVTRASALSIAEGAVLEAEELKTQASLNQAKELLNKLINQNEKEKLELRLDQVQKEINLVKSKKKKVEAIKELVESINYVAVSKDGLDIEPTKKWTKPEAKAKLEKTENEIIEMLSLEQADYTVTKGSEIEFQKNYDKLSNIDSWKVDDSNILEITNQIYTIDNDEFGGRKYFDIRVRGLKEGITQIRLFEYRGPEIDSLTIKVIDESLIDFTEEELDSTKESLTTAIQLYEAAKESGLRESDKVNYQKALKALELAEKTKERVDYDQAERYLELVAKGEEKSALRSRLAQLKLEIAVPLMITSYEGSDKNVKIPGFIEGGAIQDGKYGDFSIEGSIKPGEIGVVDRIEGYAFYKKGLDSVEIPDHVQEIGVYAFASNNLQDLKLPSKLTRVAANSFNDAYRGYNYQNRKLIIPEGIIEIGVGAFKYNQLEEVELPESLMEIAADSFTSNRFKKINLPVNLVKIGDSAFSFNNLVELVIPEKVETIERSAFSRNSLTQITIPDNVKEIGSYAFYSNLLEEVDIPTGISRLSQGIFSENRLKSIIIPDNIKRIDYLAFESNILSSITLPSDLEIRSEILGANNRLKESYEATGRTGGIYKGSQSGDWVKE